jgi:phosphatidate cytidylyltransferase
VSALAQRVCAALVLIPAVVAAVLWLPTGGFALVLGAFALVGASEWCQIGQLPKIIHVGFVAAVALCLIAIHFTMHLELVMLAVLLSALLWWLLALFAVLAQQREIRLRCFDNTLVRFLAGGLTLVPAWASLVWLHSYRPTMVLFVLVLIWVADSAAFFAGRRFGRHKLASRVSPGKSWEGVAGGLLAVVMLAVGVAMANQSTITSPALFVVLSFIVALASVLGDLIESLFKRRAGVKDSGTLIPGHGGVLDRIDSLTAAGPCFAAGWFFSGGMA